MPLKDRSPGSDDTVLRGGSLEFATTHWSVILTAGEAGSPQARAAMEKLCQTYWYPVYAFIRREGHRAHDAQDLTQEFFARLLEKNDLPAAGHVRTRFRSFLLGAVRHFLANEWDRARALKRGAQRIAALDGEAAEARYRLETPGEATPEKIYERRWAMALLEQVLARLEAEYAACGKSALFDELKSALTGSGNVSAYAGLAGKLNMSEGAIKTAVHRLRKRYRELLCAEIRSTVSAPADVEEELRHLMAAISS